MLPSDLPHVLQALAIRRPVFHSEADFQHELALVLQTLPSVRSVRLERPFRLAGATINLDILVGTEAGAVALELKHWRKAGRVHHDGEDFVTTSDGAHDLARYDFWKDVYRVEQLIETRSARWGAVIAITDDPSYWTLSRRTEVLDTAFRLHEGREVGGVLSWARQTGTTRGRVEDLALAGRYRVAWSPYSNPGREFRVVTTLVGGS